MSTIQLPKHMHPKTYVYRGPTNLKTYTFACSYTAGTDGVGCWSLDEAPSILTLKPQSSTLPQKPKLPGQVYGVLVQRIFQLLPALVSCLMLHVASHHSMISSGCASTYGGKTESVFWIRLIFFSLKRQSHNICAQ